MLLKSLNNSLIKEYYLESEFKKPSAENDQTYLDIEPITGMVLRAHKRIQVKHR